MILPESSYAWGPGVHIKLGLDIINSIHKIAPALADIIVNNHYYYLYGSISPDIIIGKKYAKEINHCHNWEVGSYILSKSENDAETAFAYGYLSHLAADAVAHNYFVPNQIISNFMARTLRHTYWEMRYDRLMERDIWEIFKEIPRDVRRESNKKLKKILTTTIFSFSTNKRIFNGIMHINRISRWRSMIESVSDKSQWTLTKKDEKNYYKLTLNSLTDLMQNNETASCLNADPNGTDALKVATKIRKDLKILNKQGKLSPYDTHRILNELKPHFIRRATSREKKDHTIRVL
jgi:hypothetical protein